MSERLTLTIPEAAELLGISRGTAYEAARDGSLPTIKLGSRRIVVPRARLLAMPMARAGELSEVTTA